MAIEKFTLHVAFKKDGHPDKLVFRPEYLSTDDLRDVIFELSAELSSREEVPSDA